MRTHPSIILSEMADLNLSRIIVVGWKESDSQQVMDLSCSNSDLAMAIQLLTGVMQKRLAEGPLKELKD